MWGAWMDSRLRGNDGCLCVLGIPRRREFPARNAGPRCLPQLRKGRGNRAGTTGVCLGVLGMGSRLRGNDGCLGAAACWGWIPAFAGTTDGLGVHDGCGRAGAGMRGNDGGRSVGAGMAEVRAGRDAVTVTVIPAKAAIHPPPTTHYPQPVLYCLCLVIRFPFPARVSRPSFGVCSRQPRRRAAPYLPDLRPRFPKPSPRRTSVRRHGVSWDGFSGAA